MPKKAKKKAAAPKQKAQGSAQSAALAVQFTRRLSDRRSMKHGVTRAESEALHDGLGDDQLDLPFPFWDEDLIGEQELLGAAAAAESGIGPTSPITEEFEMVGRAAAELNNVGLDVGNRAVMFGARLLKRRDEQHDTASIQRCPSLPIGSGQLPYLGILERTATASRGDLELVDSMNAAGEGTLMHCSTAAMMSNMNPIGEDDAALLPQVRGRTQRAARARPLRCPAIGVPASRVSVY